MPQISVINESTVISDADVQNMLPAFSQQWNQESAAGLGRGRRNFLLRSSQPGTGLRNLVGGFPR